MEKPYGGRATLNPAFDGMEIVIPAKKNILIMAFMGFWLCGWLFGEVVVLGMLLGGEALGGAAIFMLAWLGAWTVGGLYAMSIFWWMFRGREVITVTPGRLTIEKRGSLFFRTKTYDPNEIKKVRVQEALPYNVWGRYSDVGGFFNIGIIRFDYGLKTVQMAGGIDEAEAHHIIEQLKSRRLLTDKNF
jgi:hypothetical protein